ncbi:MAG: hypothetical protein GTN70_07940 [Deltaproteobacteria bacterium]|nr:hypothetical protein [Deltaproteobacteria bacterium]NIS77629.1 hypothetical protein [Deltaproteobacteria bacterium]
MGVITVSRQYGTGGEEVAQRVADKIGYSMVGQEKIESKLVQIADEGTAERVVAEKSPRIIDRLTGDVRVTRSLLMESILSFAMGGSVMLLGRGSFDILRDVSGVLHVLFTDSPEKRESHTVRAEGLTLTDAREKIRKIDRERAGFLKYYFDREWPDPAFFHLSITPLTTGLERSTELVLRLAEMMDLGPSFEGEGRNIVGQRHLLAAIKNRVVLHAGLEIDLFSLELMEGNRIGMKFSRALGVKVSPVPSDLRDKAIKVAGDFAEGYTVVQA